MCLCGKELTVIKTMVSAGVASKVPMIQAFCCYNKICGLRGIVQLKETK